MSWTLESSDDMNFQEQTHKDHKPECMQCKYYPYYTQPLCTDIVSHITYTAVARTQNTTQLHWHNRMLQYASTMSEYNIYSAHYIHRPAIFYLPGVPS